MAQAEIRLAPQGSSIAALQADLLVNPRAGISVTAATAVAAGSKEIHIADLGNGRRRILLSGLNQSVLTEGVIAVLQLNLSPDMAPGLLTLQLTTAVAVDPSGEPVPLTTIDGSLTILPSLPVSALAFRGALTQLVSGGGWRSSIFLLNRTGSRVNARVQFFSDQGGELQMPFSSGTISSIDRTIEPFGLVVLESNPASNSLPVVGWARVRASGDISAYAVLRQPRPDGKDTEAVVALDRGGHASGTLFFDNAQGFSTGIALANLSDLSSALTVIVRDQNGAFVGQDVIYLAPRGHLSFKLSDRIPLSRERYGSIELDSGFGGNVVVLGLRFTPSGSVSAVPVTF